MIVSVMVIIFSGLMFLYWFRYSCRLILETNHSQDMAADVALATDLRLMAVEEILQQNGRQLPEPKLDLWLEEDFRKLRRLVGAAMQQDGVIPLDHHMLRAHFSVHRGLYWLTRSWNAALAQESLREMTAVVHHYANTWAELNPATSRG